MRRGLGFEISADEIPWQGEDQRDTFLVLDAGEVEAIIDMVVGVEQRRTRFA